MLELRQISLRYRGQQNYLLKDLSFRFQPGTLNVLTGSNGCGKTSLLNIISGIIPTHSSAELCGQVILNQADITQLPLSLRYRYLSYQMTAPETQFFFPSLAHEFSFPLENMGLAPSEIRSRITAASQFFGVTDIQDTDAATCSPGQQKLLLWTLCELIDAPLILLDEPCSGVSPAKLELLSAWIQSLTKRGKTVIAAEHDAAFIARAEQILRLDSSGGHLDEL